MIMKTKKLTKNVRNTLSLLTIFVLSSVLIIPLYSQEFLYGPQNPPPKESSITFTGTENDGLIGFPGGKVYTFTNIILANSTTAYWTMLEDAVKLSMDDSGYLSAENMPFNPGLSNLPGGVLIWTGATRIPIANAAGTGIDHYANLLSKFIMTVYDQSNAAISLVSPTITGLPEYCGGAVLISSNAMVFKAKMEMFVSDDNGGTWTPHLTYYNAAQTPAGLESVYS